MLAASRIGLVSTKVADDFLRVHFFFSFCLHVSGSRRIPHRSGEQTNNAVAVRLAEKLFVKKSSSRAAVHPSAPLLSRAWKPAELITSAPFSGSGGEGKAGHKKGGEGT